MGNRYFGSKATAGLCQPLIALMPPHSVYIETHLGGGAIMKRKPAALRNIGIDRNGRALSEFRCGYPVELAHGCCHRFLRDYPFDGTELVYSDPPYLHSTRKSARRYRHDYGDGDHEALLAWLRRLHEALAGWEAAAVERLLAMPVLHADETSLRVERKNHWLHSYSADDLTLKFVHPRRGCAAIDELNVIPRYGGILIHGRWASYFAL